MGKMEYPQNGVKTETNFNKMLHVKNNTFYAKALLYANQVRLEQF